MVSSQVQYQATELNNKFKRLIHFLGSNNSSGLVYKDGTVVRLANNEGEQIGPTERYKFEVEFAYIMDEILNGPQYIVQKNIDRAELLIADIISSIKKSGVETSIEA